MRRYGGMGAVVVLAFLFLSAGPTSAADEVCRTVTSDNPIVSDITAADVTFTVTGPNEDGVYIYVAHTDAGTIVRVAGTMPTTTTETGITIGGGGVFVGDTMDGIYISLTACYEPTSIDTTTTSLAANKTTTTEPPDTTTSTDAPAIASTATTVADTTTTSVAAATTTPESEELPYTGSNQPLGVFAIVGLALIGLGTAMVRTNRG